ncbi:MAG TPA: PAS domain-containing protein [Stellaceae bacterium]|nr:PAS domain-containing protein [Stellaceae bacterium]
MSSIYRFALDPDVSDDPSFADLVAYWNAKRGQRDAPLRSDIDPIEMRSHLGSLVIIECLTGLEDFRYKLIGTNIVKAYGRDSTGKTVRELYGESDREYRDYLLDLYRNVVTQKKIGRGQGTLRPVARDYRLFDTLVMPLYGAGGTIQFMLNEVHFN